MTVSQEEMASSLLAILVYDLEYEKSPIHGFDPIRHQLAWNHCVEILGADVVDEFVKHAIEEVSKGRNGAVKTSSLKR